MDMIKLEDNNNIPENAIEYRSHWGGVYHLTFELTRYVDNNTLAIQMICWDDGYAEPFAVLTVNLEDSDTLPPDTQYVDINDLGNDILNWIEENNLGTAIGLYGFSGYVTYPAVQFNIDEIKAHCTADYTLEESVQYKEAYTGPLEAAFDLYDCYNFDCLNRKINELFADTDIYEACREISDKYRDQCAYDYNMFEEDSTYYWNANDFEAEYVEDAVNEIFNTYFK